MPLWAQLCCRWLKLLVAGAGRLPSFARNKVHQDTGRCQFSDGTRGARAQEGPGGGGPAESWNRGRGTGVASVGRKAAVAEAFECVKNL